MNLLPRCYRPVTVQYRYMLVSRSHLFAVAQVICPTRDGSGEMTYKPRSAAFFKVEDI